MTRILLPEHKERPLVFYLAMEEYIAGETGIGDAFFMWTVAPTVIFGRNQVMEAEVNLPWCRKHGVSTYRRKSGGGCVYSDRGNLMISYITSSGKVRDVFSEYLGRLADAVSALGVEAEVSGRNDIMIGGKKVSGNAFQMLPSRSIVHGTLLFDTDFDALEAAITPSEDKIAGKGVKSVRQHVVNLKSCLGDRASAAGVTDMDSLQSYLYGWFCDSSYMLDGDDVRRIEEIQNEYLDPDFIAGKSRNGTYIRKSKIDRVGEIAFRISLDGGLIDDVSVSGDYFSLKEPAEVDALFRSSLAMVPMERKAVSEALGKLPVGEYILNLNVSCISSVFFDND